MKLSTYQDQLNRNNPYDFTSLKAIFLNCTLKPTGKLSHTEGLIKMSQAIMEVNGIQTEIIRPVDYDIAPGVYPDMREHGFESDDWPAIQSKIMDANILVIGTPIWLGEKSSVASQAIERLYGFSSKTNEKGQYAYYGKVGGCLVTGNEDGIKHCAMSILYALQHLGYTIPPQADAGWIGEAGPGPSYLDKNSGGLENNFTNRNTTFMTWNLMHQALAFHKAGGISAYGNQRTHWDNSEHNDHPNPEYRSSN